MELELQILSDKIGGLWNTFLIVCNESIVEPIGTPLEWHLLRRSLSLVRRGGNLGTVMEVADLHNSSPTLIYSTGRSISPTVVCP